MKILMINVVCGIRSTGRICTDLAISLEDQGNEVKIAYGREEVPKEYEQYAVRIGTNIDVITHGIKARIFDRLGFGSKKATKKFIQWVREYNPDIIHLHNLHGYYINIEILFDYLKTCKKKIIWTLHDCWTFTGHCTYFDYVQCEKWKKGCRHCPQKNEYPKRYFIDQSKKNYYKKQQIFSNIPNLTLVTPSYWLASLVKQSFLKEYPLKIIHNGVDTNIFKPINSNLRNKYGLQNRIVILGIAAVWDKRKGLNTFLKLSKVLSKEYKIILVGLSQKQLKHLPSNIIGIKKTNSIKRLIELYTMADIFVNPTLEDNYPTTNIEAIACETPVITYSTGGSVESAKMYGTVVSKNNVSELVNAIKNIKKIKKNNIEINYKNTIKKYMELYRGEKII